MLYDISDISNGLEQIPIVAKNRYTFDTIPPFKYINVIEIPLDLQSDFKRVKGCKCSGSCAKNECDCSEKDEFIMEFCDLTICSCSDEECGNRLCDTLTLKVPLQVYFVNAVKRWGVRCEDNIAKGQIVFEYAGVLEEDNDSYADNDYIFFFEHEDKSYMINAREKGNVTRFMNHACLPNMRPIMIIDDVPHIGFIALRDIARGEELTFNYGPLWWGPKSEVKCACESPYCEYRREVIVLQ